MKSEESKIKFVMDRMGHDFRYSLKDSKFRSIGIQNKFNLKSSLGEIVDQIKKYALN